MSAGRLFLLGVDIISKEVDNMPKMVAYCGLVCTDCPAYIATQEDDDQKKREIAQTWSTEEETIQPEEINCDGCLPQAERHNKFCQICEVRTCGIEKGVQTCAHCQEYPCNKLDDLYQVIDSPEAKETLDEIKESL